MNYYTKLLIEAICVGIAVVIIGSFTGFLITYIYPMPNLPKKCSEYNKFFIMETTLFLTGFLVHLLCEFGGLNKWYTKNGAVLMK
tara:strand:- start:667 stop:921 length:255 start_codon:yes stop_codon:yes gene_type:complete